VSRGVQKAITRRIVVGLRSLSSTKASVPGVEELISDLKRKGWRSVWESAGTIIAETGEIQLLIEGPGTNRIRLSAYSAEDDGEVELDIPWRGRIYSYQEVMRKTRAVARQRGYS
jgi:hypothetical protein